MGLEPIEKHILSVSCLPIPPQEHIVTVLRTAKRLVRLRGLEPQTCRLKSRLLCQLSYKHLLRVYHIVLGNAD